jgi:hypothetical protein
MFCRALFSESRREAKSVVVVAIFFDEFELPASWHSAHPADSCLTLPLCLTLTRVAIAALSVASLLRLDAFHD